MEDALNPVTGLEDKNINPSDKLTAFVQKLQETPTGDNYNPFAVVDLDYKSYLKTLGEDKFKAQFGEEALREEYNKVTRANHLAELQQKADDQGLVKEFANSWMQTVVGEIVGGTLESFGHMFNFDGFSADYMKDQQEYGNWLVQLGSGIKEGIKDEFPVYLDPGTEGDFNPFSTQWWASNIPSIASALSILIPVAGEAKAVSWLGKAAKWLNEANKGARILKGLDKSIELASKMGQTSRWIAGGIHSAAVSRHIEGGMEAKQVFDETYDKYLGLGYTKEEANLAAAEAASFNYKANWAMFVTDLPQYLLLGGNKFTSRAITSRSLARAAGTSEKAAMVAYGKELGSQAALEGFEEGYQYIISEEAKYNVDKRHGLAKETLFGERFKKYLAAGEMQTSMFFGAIGGAGMHGTMKSGKLANLYNKGIGGLWGNPEYRNEKDRRIDEITNRWAEVASNNEAYNEAVKSGDVGAIEAAKKRIIFDLATNAAQVGNADLLRNNLNNLSNMSEEELNKMELPADFKENIEVYKKEADNIIGLWEKNSNKYHAATVNPITYREVMLAHYKEKRPELEQAIKELEKQIPGFDRVSPLGKDTMGILSEIEARKKFIENQTKLLKDTELTKADKSFIQDIIKINQDIIDDAQAVYDSIIENNGKAWFKDTDGTYVQGKINRELQKDTFVVDYRRTKEVNGKITTENFTTTKNRNELTVYDRETDSHSPIVDRLTNNDINVLDLVKNKYIGDLHKAQTSLLHLDAYVEAMTKDLARLTSYDYQYNIQKDIDKRQKQDKEKKDKEKKEAKQREAEAKVEPPVTNLSEDEDNIVEDEEEEGEEGEITNDDLDHIIGMIDSGSMDEDKLQPDIKEKIKKRREELELEKAREAHSAVLETSIVSDEQETPDDTTVEEEVEKGTVDTDPSLLSTINALAWLSVNNRSATNEEKANAANIALTNYLEDYRNDLSKISLVFDIDFEYIEREIKNGDPKFKAMKEALDRAKKDKIQYNAAKAMFPYLENDGTASDLMGYFPIKATLHKGGVPLKHMGETLSLYLHTEDYSVNPNIDATFKHELNLERVAIYRAFLEGKRLQSSGVKKSNGHLYIETDQNVLSKRTLLQVLGEAKTLELLVGTGNKKDGIRGAYINYKKDTVETGGIMTSTAGAIYANIRTANESSFPLRLQVSKLTNAESHLIYKLMSAIVTDPDAFSRKLDSDFIKGINEHSEGIIKDMAKYLELSELSHKDLLDHLVYNGNEKTSGKGESALLTWKEGDVVWVKFGNNKVTATDLLKEENKIAFINHISTYRRRQVNRSLLNNLEYKKYLSNHKILTTNVKQDRSHNLFVQPTISFNPQLSKYTPAENKQKEAAKPNGEPIIEVGVQTQEQISAKIKEFKDRVLANQKLVQGKTPDDKFYLINGKPYRRVSNVIEDNFKGDTTKYYAARNAGIVTDNIVRGFFEGKTKEVILNTQLTKLESAEKDANGKNKNISGRLGDYINDAAYENLITELKAIKAKIIANGEEFLANNVIVFDETNMIAGELDILSIKKDGSVNIYDLKTSQDFTNYETKNRKKHTDQLSAYSNIIQNQYGVKVSTLAILPIRVEYNQNGAISNTEKLDGIKIIYDPNISSVVPLKQNANKSTPETKPPVQNTQTGTLTPQQQGVRTMKINGIIQALKSNVSLATDKVYYTSPTGQTFTQAEFYAANEQEIKALMNIPTDNIDEDGNVIESKEKPIEIGTKPLTIWDKYKGRLEAKDDALNETIWNNLSKTEQERILDCL
jgi:hypothetical protein